MSNEFFEKLAFIFGKRLEIPMEEITDAPIRKFNLLPTGVKNILLNGSKEEAEKVLLELKSSDTLSKNSHTTISPGVESYINEARWVEGKEMINND